MNIVDTFHQATPENKAVGKRWYQEAHNYCLKLSKHFKQPLEVVVGIVAALSPRREWNLNKRQARFFFEGQRNLQTRVQMTKCEWILAGHDIPTALGGMKTVNFYLNILNPKDPDSVTIDRHMLKFYPEVTNLTPKKYTEIMEDFKITAHYEGTIANRVQATCWLEVKNKKS